MDVSLPTIIYKQSERAYHEAFQWITMTVDEYRVWEKHKNKPQSHVTSKSSLADKSHWICTQAFPDQI